MLKTHKSQSLPEKSEYKFVRFLAEQACPFEYGRECKGKTRDTYYKNKHKIHLNRKLESDQPTAKGSFVLSGESNVHYFFVQFELEIVLVRSSELLGN